MEKKMLKRLLSKGWYIFLSIVCLFFLVTGINSSGSNQMLNDLYEVQRIQEDIYNYYSKNEKYPNNSEFFFDNYQIQLAFVTDTSVVFTIGNLSSRAIEIEYLNNGRTHWKITDD